ncbi:hypothetical protein AAC387_Pa02g1425 [Persea americana]
MIEPYVVQTRTFVNAADPKIQNRIKPSLLGFRDRRWKMGDDRLLPSEASAGGSPKMMVPTGTGAPEREGDVSDVVMEGGER